MYGVDSVHKNKINSMSGECEKCGEHALECACRCSTTKLLSEVNMEISLTDQEVEYLTKALKREWDFCEQYHPTSGSGACIDIYIEEEDVIRNIYRKLTQKNNNN